MKNVFNLLVAVFLTVSNVGFAQSVDYSNYGEKSGNSLRVNLYGSYAFKDSFDSYYDYGNYYQGQLQDGFQYGLGLEYEIKPSVNIELLYLREDTNAPTQYYNGGLFDKYEDFDVSMNYILLAGNKGFRKKGSVFEGFGGIMAGMAIIGIDSSNGNYSNTASKFAWGAKCGAIVWANDKVGIKFQAQLISAVQSLGGGAAFGTGGVGVGVSANSSLYQMTLGGGLVFSL
jgi:hypothetical protein